MSRCQHCQTDEDFASDLQFCPNCGKELDVDSGSETIDAVEGVGSSSEATYDSGVNEDPNSTLPPSVDFPEESSETDALRTLDGDFFDSQSHPKDEDGAFSQDVAEDLTIDSTVEATEEYLTESGSVDATVDIDASQSDLTIDETLDGDVVDSQFSARDGNDAFGHDSSADLTIDSTRESAEGGLAESGSVDATVDIDASQSDLTIDETLDGDVVDSQFSARDENDAFGHDSASDLTIDSTMESTEGHADESGSVNATVDVDVSQSDLTVDETLDGDVVDSQFSARDEDAAFSYDAAEDLTIDSTMESSEGHLTESGLIDATVDFDASEPDLTIDEALGATIESVSSDDAERDETYDSDAGSHGDSSDSRATMDSSVGSASDSKPVRVSSRFASSSGYNSQLGATGNASKLARIWDKVGGESANPMSSVGSDEQIASATLFGKLCERTLSAPNAPGSGDSDYELLNKLGEGAMGVVFAARQKAMDRTVAIKAIKPGKQTDDSKRKFLYEAQITGDLDHPNIVPIHELGANSDGTLFYAMKMVSGTPWQKVIKTKSREENLDILMKVSDAMGFAHSKGIIHRDLKPENVMLGQFGEVLVMDWGLAISLLRRQQFGIGGTPVYMAPEMARHDKKRIGRQSDIYLLGAMLFQFVAGRAPHPGKKVRECLMAAVRNEFVPHDEKDPLLAIAKVAMATDVADRYETVAAFQDAIREYRRHAESIAITERAATLLVSAKEKRDYQSFSRVLFSLDEALDLWPENTSAKRQVAEARLAYGQCAYDKGDHDLCLQTLLPGHPDEDELIAKAEAARDIAASREQKFKRLRKVLASVILFAVVGLSGLSVFLNSARIEISKQRGELAETNASLSKAIVAARKALVAESEALVAESKARVAESKARKDAEQSAEQEKLAKEEEKLARMEEEVAKEKAIKAAAKAKRAQEFAEKAALAEATARQDEAKARVVAESALESEKVALEKSLRSAMVTTLGSYQSRLNLALAQAEQYDVVRSSQLLSEIKTIETQFPINFQQSSPLLSNWAFRRVGLLTNEDLPRLEVGNGIRSVSLASTAPMLATANEDGQLHRFRLSPQAGIQRLATPKLDGKAVHVAASPDGTELAFMTVDRNNRFASWIWSETTGVATELPGIGERPLQSSHFSPNGEWLVGGINGGLWIWERTNGSFTKQPRRALAKGSLRSLQFGEIDGRVVANCLVDITAGDQSTLLLIRLGLDSGQTRVVDLPPILHNRLSALAMFGDQGDLLAGTANGQLFQLRLSGAEYQLVSEVLPRKHATRISQIDVSQDGVFVTHGDEPVAHVWSLSAEDNNQGISYQQTLLGMANNIQWCGHSADGKSILAIDQSGQSIQWNLSEQASRRGMIPAMGSRDGLAGLPSAIKGVVANQRANTFQTMDGNGVLAQYSSQFAEDDHATSIAPNAVHYTGHTPNAEILDAAFTAEIGQLVTLARRTAGDEYEMDAIPRGVEYCQWDMKSGNMVRRLDFDIDSEARVELAANGSIACVGGDSGTHLISLQDGGVTTRSFGSSFAVANPTADTEVMLVRSTGAIQLINVVNANTPVVNQFQLAAYTEARPIDGLWSGSGKFFYVLYENGRLARYAVGVGTIGEPTLSDEIATLRVLQRVRAWQSVDLHCVSNQPTSDELACIIRTNDGRISSTLSRLRWSHDSDQPDVTSDQSLADDHRLSVTSTTKQAQLVPLKAIGFSLSNRLVRSLVQVDADHWIAVGSNGDIQFGSEKSDRSVHRTGRTGCVSASPDRLGDRWLVLQDNGCLWRVDNDGGTPRWQLLPNIDQSMTTFQLSPSGNHAVGLSVAKDEVKSVTLYDIETGKQLRRWDNVTRATWHPIEDRLLIASDTGELSETRMGDPNPSTITIASIDLLGDQVRDIGYFRDAGSDGEAEWYAAILRDHQSGSRISLHVCNKLPEQQASEFGFLESKTPISTMASSPTENILVTGDESGTLIVWFAAPSLDESPRELFTLPGHRGSPIQCVKFSIDGSVLFSADEDRRMIGHPSNGDAAGDLNIARVGLRP